MSFTRRSRFTETALFLAALGLVLLGIMGFAQRSQATPVTLKFDNARLSLGPLLQDQTVLPAPDKFPSDSLPTPQRTDMELIGTETDGALNFPASLNTGLQFPYMAMNHPVEDLKIPITMRLNEPGLTGTWDPETGAATLEGTIDLIIVTGQGTSFPVPDSLDDLGVPPLGLFARCRINDLPVSFSTSGKLPYSGQPFAGGFGVDGSMSTFWDEITSVTSENGGDCGLLATVVKAYGGMWLSNGIVETQFHHATMPTCPEDPTLCPDSEDSVKITGLKVKPGHRSIRAGRHFALKVRVTNSGTLDAKAVKVRLHSTNRRVRVPKLIKVAVPAGSTVARRIKVTAGGRARGKARISVSAAGLRSRVAVTVKKKR